MLFNRDAYGLPAFRETVLKVRYGQHSLARAREKGIVLPATVAISKATVVEIDDVENKFTIRLTHDAKRDIVLVVLSDGFVKTVWLNDKADNHRTLNKAPYSRVPNVPTHTIKG